MNEIAATAQRRLSQPSGWWGMALFLSAEATLFGVLIATYFYLRLNTSAWPPPPIKPPGTLLPLLLTAALVLTSVPIWAASRAARSGEAARSRNLILAALLVQGAYLAVQVHLFAEDLGRFKGTTNAYGSIYFTLLGAHHAHVLFGLLLSAGMMARLASGLNRYRTIGVRSLALYWHTVNILAICVVLTQVSPSL